MINHIPNNKKIFFLSLRKLWIYSFIIWLSVTLILFCFSFYFFAELNEFVCGFSYGFFVAIINLQLLGFIFIRIIFKKNNILIFIGFVLSLCFLSLSAFIVFELSEKALFGFIFGVYSIVLIGFFYKLN
jgi:hypothetical protein